MDYLNDMAFFVEIAKTRSFRRAAENLGMPNSTLSRRITLLEKGIGLRLMNRTTRKIELTEAGEVYFERCRRIVEEARIAYEELGAMVERPEGVLRVSMPVDFATTYVAPLLPTFASLYPGIRFEMDLTPRNVDLVGEPFDLALRAGVPENTTLITSVLTRLSAKLFASPAYLAQNGEPATPEQLGRHECLTMPTMRQWHLVHGVEKESPDVGSRFETNSVSMIRRLSNLGLGIAFLPERIVAEDLRAGRLQRVLPEWEGVARPIYALTETHLIPAKTQRFLEFLREGLRAP